MEQNYQRPFSGLDVTQALIADLGVALANLGPGVREQAGVAHEDLRG
jgi:hypothetical protein